MDLAPNERTFSARYVNREEARRRFGPRADQYGASQLRGDPLADAVVAWLHRAGPRGSGMIDLALARGIGAIADPPDELERFFASIDRVPEWVDFARIDRGARVYQRVGPATLLILSAWSLMNGYHCGPAVKPLAFTRQLESMAPRRLAETGRFITEVSQVGGLQRHARGLETAVRVRLMHAHVRAALSRASAWRTDDWGVPINQGDMLGTVVEFSLLWLRGAEMMGFQLEPEEREDVLHLWRYAGSLMGVEEQLLSFIDSIESGVRTSEMLFLVQPGPDGDSLALAAALRDVPRQIARTRFEHIVAPLIERYHDGLTWAFNGEEIAGALGIPNAVWRHSLVPTRLLVRSMERVRRALPGGTWLATELGNRRVRAQIAYILERREPTFRAVSRIDESRNGRAAHAV